MSYVEDIGTTARRSMAPSRVLRLWEKHKGCCVICGQKIDGAREDWFIEHPRALELGGPDSDDNAGPAHLYHKAKKDAADHSAAARAKRRKRKHLGIRKATARPMPHGRNSPTKRKINGEVVQR